MNNNYEKMQEFLDIIKEFAISNPEKEITRDFVYSILVRFRVEKNEESFMPAVKQDYYGGWKERFKNVDNLNVDDHVQGDFCWFLNTYDVHNAVKLYIPMDYEHVQEGANQLFDFIVSTGMKHQSKIASKIRNDNVVVRVNSLEDAEKIIDFVSSNRYIRSGMLLVNPFLPNINGIGIVMDNNYSFNSTLCDIICNFLSSLRRTNRLDLFTVEELNKYIKTQIPNISDLELKDIYKLLSITTSKDYKFQDVIDHIEGKLVDKYDNNRERIIEPSYYLDQAIIVTERYYPGNSKPAILKYINGNADSFTRKERARQGIIKYVSPQNILTIMKQKLQECGNSINGNASEIIDLYLNLVLKKNERNITTDLSKQNNYEFEFNIIKKAYSSTLIKYGIEQAETAFKQLFLYKDSRYFTNSLNDRTNLNNYVVNKNVKEIILRNIDISGLDMVFPNVNDILERFKRTIVNNNKKL